MSTQGTWLGKWPGEWFGSLQTDPNQMAASLYGGSSIDAFLTKIIVGRSLKYWTGSAWEPKPLKRWDGSQWVSATPRYYNGSTWA